MAPGKVSMPRLGQGRFFMGAHLHPAPSSVGDVAKDLAGLQPFTEEAEDAEIEKEFLRISRKIEQYRKENEVALQRELEDRLLDFDPKQGGRYYTRFHYADLRRFDLDEESPLGPMRFTNTVFKDKDDYELCEGINIFSVKISSSDVGFPIHVYGTVIARDSVDHKCVYLFRRDRDNCQIINSEDESLLLTGPKRGLALISSNYIETDLKIKDHQGKDDRELSKGFLTIRGIERRSLDKCVVETVSLETRLSTVDVMYGFVANAVEGTVAIEVRQGCFDGQITAHTTNIENSIVLYDRELYGAMTGDDGTGVIQLVRPVVSVSVKERLVIVVKTRDGKSERIIKFTPRISGAEEDVVVWVDGVLQMCVKVTWSLLDY